MAAAAKSHIKRQTSYVLVHLRNINDSSKKRVDEIQFVSRLKDKNGNRATEEAYSDVLGLASTRVGGGREGTWDSVVR